MGDQDPGGGRPPTRWEAGELAATFDPIAEELYEEDVRAREERERLEAARWMRAA